MAVKKAADPKYAGMTDAFHLLAAIEATMDGIGIVDRDGILIFMNRALRDLHGIEEGKEDKFIGQPWTMLYTDKGRREIEEDVMPVLEREGYWRGESPIVRMDGKVITAELSLTRLEGGGFVGTARDVTERRRSEQENKDLRENLYQAQKMEAIGRLAGGIAHDFNNILAAMNGYAEFLMDDLDKNSPQHKFALSILQAGLQGKALVDQMLAFSRRQQSAMQIVDLNKPLRETLSMLKATVPKSIDVVTAVPGEPVLISCNPGQIGQALMNLAVNALDAMTDSYGRLTVELKMAAARDYDLPAFVRDAAPAAEAIPDMRIEDIGPGHTRMTVSHIASDRPYASLSVGDTGSGMARVIMERIFEPFFTTKSVDEGTGLGLSTVHGVIAAHRGAMIVESELGKGTKFEILLPLAEGAAAALQEEDEPASALSGTGRILLVEDQENVRDMMTNMLTRLGYEVQACAGGLEALDILREKPGFYDLVVTDHNMPRMSGLELAQQAALDMPDLPFMLVSGYSQQKIQEMMHEQTVIKAVLRKPVSKAAMAQKIKEVIRKKS